LKLQDEVEANLVCLKRILDKLTKTGVASRNSLNFPSSKVEKAGFFETSTNGNERDLFVGGMKKKVNHFELCFLWKDHFLPVFIPESRNQMGMDLV